MKSETNYIPDQLIADDIEAYLEGQEQKTMLRVLTCGSVDDGKSTLIGRLLYDSNAIFDDQLSALKRDSETVGTQGKDIDFALLVDGLAAEREQGITIDVAYRYFSTPKRKFIIADTPGHEQYTRNMVTGASNADVAIILIDARKGVLSQTKRHAYIVNLLGIGKIILAINKMDLVNYSRDIFEQINTQFGEFANSIGINDFYSIPISSLKGDNVTNKSINMEWYDGYSLIEYLESDMVYEAAKQGGDFFLPVQNIQRPNSEFRGYSGLIADGEIAVDDKICVYPSKISTAISRIIIAGEDKTRAISGQSVTLCFKDEIDVARGDIIARENATIEIADIFDMTLIWMSDAPMIPGRPYWLKIGTNTISATIKEPKFQINTNNLEHIAAKTLKLNAIASVNITTEKPIAFTPYAKNKTLGSFILIDKTNNSTVGAGIINFSLRRTQNIHWQEFEVDRKAHAEQKSQKPMVLWLTGLSGSGKTTIANILEKKLFAMGFHTFLLDGDNVRHGLNKDLGFSEADRIENIRRIAETAKLMTDAGLIVIAAFISPFIAQRDLARSLLPKDEFCEVFVDAPLEIAEKRDPKGLYKKARSGELMNFTGIDSPYERPPAPDLHIDTTQLSADDAANLIIERIIKNLR